MVAGWLLAWSNHFQSSFHFNDFPTLVSNRSVQHLSNFVRFFTTPRISSVEKDSVSYRPLLSAWFAFDYQVLGGKGPFLYQAENFGWFTAVAVALFGFLRLLPGVNGYAAWFATMIFALHPVTADTVNYAQQRGTLMAAFGVIAGLLIFVFWPWHLPQSLPLKLKRVPEHGFDEYLRKNYQKLEARYLKLIHLPIGMYLWPVIPALLCDASTAVFAPILAVYIALFETKRSLRSVIPAAVICGGYWIFQVVMMWNFVPFSRVPAANYWFSQPWVAMRYLFRFFVPIHLSVDSDFFGLAHFWDPAAIAGVIGVAVLCASAVALGKRPRWRAVSFGIWWFLIALLPAAVQRHRAVEADWRMFLPFAGLAIALAGTVSVAIDAWLPKAPEEPEAHLSGKQISIYVGVASLAIGLLAVLGWATHARNEVWESEASLWQNATEASPGNGRALMNLGLTKLNDRDFGLPLNYMKRADSVTPGDPVIEINLALAYSRLSRSGEAEGLFRNAIEYGKTYSPSWSAYGLWLLNESRLREAGEMATKAVELDPYDMSGRRTLMEILGQQHEWTKLKDLAEETLKLLPDDADGQRSLQVAQTGIDNLGHAAKEAISQPTVDHYLQLSRLSCEAHRYAECIDAAREALKLDPNLGEAYGNIATAYHLMGNHLDDTIAALQEEVRLNPALPSAKSNLEFELAVKRGEIEEGPDGRAIVTRNAPSKQQPQPQASR